MAMLALVTALFCMGANAQTLRANQALMAGQQLYSANGKYRLVMQAGDGNLVVYRVSDNRSIWATMAFGGAGAVMQEDRNFVVYRDITNASTHVWSSASSAPVVDTAAYLLVGDDGALTIFSGAGLKVWGTRPDPDAGSLCPSGSPSYRPSTYPVCVNPYTRYTITIQANCWADADAFARAAGYGGYAGYCR